MRISDLRKNGCFRGYNLSGWSQTSPARYEHLKPLLTTKFDSDPVFYLQQSHLPSHMRSLRLSRHTDQRAVRHVPSKLRQALVTVAVIIAFVLSLACFSLSLYYWRVKEESTPSIRQDGHESTGIPSAQSTGENNKTIQKIKDITKLVKHKKGIVKYLDSRLRCSSVTCPAYSAFRFRSSCIHGTCQCKGDNYQRTSCLPKYGDCHIEEKATTNGSVRVYNKGEQPPVFACRSSTDVTQHVHVISSFGNGGRNETTVEISGNSKFTTPVTVVLSNYQQINWRVVSKGR
uniref:Uncharacterized protein LOC111137545 n=1 Tax=Crassostrea virginica TaxID=6565 RepID=A0A8B8EXR9_CRAVI|nr:uncharacterized protein LOC111137545 [Crassostrea virginica]